MQGAIAGAVGRGADPREEYEMPPYPASMFAAIPAGERARCEINRVPLQSTLGPRGIPGRIVTLKKIELRGNTQPTLFRLSSCRVHPADSFLALPEIDAENASFHPKSCPDSGAERYSRNSIGTITGRHGDSRWILPEGFRKVENLS